MLELVHVTKYYGKNLAVNDVSFAVPDGTVGVLLGPNGAGKSTIIKSIAGLLKFKGGIGIQGIDSRDARAKRIFAYVPEMPAMYQSLSVAEHMEFIRRAYKLTITDQEVQEILERFELWDKKEKLGDELSKGMMQKVSICCALLIRPRVMLLDEPMVGLDPKAIKELKEVVLELKNHGTTVLISTHMLEMVQELWDMVFVMDKGKMIASYNQSETEGKNLDELFFQVTEHREETMNKEMEFVGDTDTTRQTNPSDKGE
ncbi:MAG: ABC transporter ATP-binding protein [Clostridia bacterium]|nr:ABC transporter ATP-binding protein [Clostridia bacterium]NCC43729.1 ABC transporter ATP-binding protein [Clostridia bacterium]